MAILLCRCFAALKDVSKMKSLQKINEMAAGDGYNHYKVRAKLAILDKQFKQAEGIYLEQVCASYVQLWSLCQILLSLLFRFRFITILGLSIIYIRVLSACIIIYIS